MVNHLHFIEKEMKAPGGEAACQLAKHEEETGDLSQLEAERQAGNSSFKMALHDIGIL